MTSKVPPKRSRTRSSAVHTGIDAARQEPALQTRATKRRARMLTAILVLGLIAGGAAIWLSVRASSINTELQAATHLIPELKASVIEHRTDDVSAIMDQLREHTGNARDAASDPLWSVASALPWLGKNFSATSEIVQSADEVVSLGIAPLVDLYSTLGWDKLIPGSAGVDLGALQNAGPAVSSAAQAVEVSTERLERLDAGSLLPQIAEPLQQARAELRSLTRTLDTASDAAKIAPSMLGAQIPRRYLLLMQNNAESRATGGIPGALAVLTVDKGRLNLESQSSAGALGVFTPPLSTDPEQVAIYSPRLGKFMQDVNLTPDFPTSAKTAQAMWKERTGERLDGVLSVDPIALSFILEATGPVTITDPVTRQIGSGLPNELSGENVVRTLLSDAYGKITESGLQDVYFAGAAKEIFDALSSDAADPKKLIEAISRGVEERRILLWSSAAEEEDTIGRYPLSGKVSGSSVSPAEFGVYFNDGTGAKMDYWMKRTVQVVKDCSRSGYREVTVRVTSTNMAPTDAASSLPAYVTGGGLYGVPAGSVQTNVVAYGPAQSNIDTVVKDGEKIPFAAQRHDQRAVGTTTERVAPGQSTTVDFNFGHIVQHADPAIVVTPTTQPAKDVVLAAQMTPCE